MKMICNEIDSKHVKLGNPELKSRVKHDKIFELAIRRFIPFNNTELTTEDNFLIIWKCSS